MLKKETNKRRVINAFVYFSYRPPIYKNKFLIVGRYKFKKTLWQWADLVEFEEIIIRSRGKINEICAILSDYLWIYLLMIRLFMFPKSC